MAWYIYNGSTWKKVKNAYRKTTPASYYATDPANFTDVSKEWRRTAAMYRKTNTGWRRVFTKTSTGVTFTTGPAIHLYSYPYPYGPNDGLSVSSPRYVNEVLYGKDGIWTPRNEISITRNFQAALAPDGSNRFTIDNNDVFDLSTSPDNQDWADETYLYYRIAVKNYGDTVTASAGPIKLIRREPSFNSENLTGTPSVGSTLSGTYNLENRWYNKPELYNSYIRWWRSTSNDPSGTLVREEYLGDHVSTNNSTSLQGSDTYTIQAADAGYYIVFQVVPYNSYNRHYGYETYMSTPSNIISSPTTISNVSFTDSNGRTGKNARGNLVTSTGTYLNWTVGGVGPTSTFRVRYRILNNQTGAYWNPDTLTTASASAAWVSYTSDYYNNGTISNVSINGSTATLYDYFVIDSTFNGSTYGGGLSRWSFEYEISTVNPSGTRYYWIYGNSISTTQASDYWDIDPTTDPSITASSTSISPGASVTFTGTFASYPASLSSYPHSYRVVYGDGSDSGWITLSSGTANQSYSQSHTYSSAGSYNAYVEVTPSSYTNYAYITASTAPNIPANLSGSANGTGASQSISLTWDASTGANTYELFFNSSGTAPTDYQAYADYKGIPGTSYTTPAYFSSSTTFYWWVRAKNASGAVGAWSSRASVTTNSQATAISGLSVTLTPTGTQMAGTKLTAGVSVTAGSTPITYTIQIFKATGSNPTNASTGLESGTTSAEHTITDSEAAGTPDRFIAYATATNSAGTVSGYSAVVTSTPYVAPVTAPSGGTATVNPTTGTAGSTTYTGSTSGWSGSAATYTYSWQYFSNTSFSYIEYTSGIYFSPPSNINTLYPNYGWRLRVSATNTAGTAYADASFTLNTPAATTTTTTTTTTTVNCSTCNSYSPSDGSYTYSATDPYGTCASGSRYYRICITPGACPNINEWGSCVPAPTTTTTTTTTNCNTCNSYAPSDGSYGYSATDPYGTCASGSRYYRICVTPGSCPNITQWGSCVPAATTTTTAAPTTTTSGRPTVYWTCNQTDVNNPSNPCTSVGQCRQAGSAYLPSGCTSCCD
jgi:hypothetical protein